VTHSFRGSVWFTMYTSNCREQTRWYSIVRFPDNELLISVEMTADCLGCVKFFKTNVMLHAAISKRTRRAVFSWPGVNHSTQPIWMESSLSRRQVWWYRRQYSRCSGWWWQGWRLWQRPCHSSSENETLNLFVLNFVWRFNCILKCPWNYFVWFEFWVPNQNNQLILYRWKGKNSISPDKEKVVVVEHHTALAQLQCDAVVRRDLVS